MLKGAVTVDGGAIPQEPLEALGGLGQDDLVRLRMALGRIGRMLRQQSDDHLSHTLIALLLAVHRMQPVTAKALAESEGVTPPAVTRSLRKLEDLKLINRHELPSDRRAQQISLTEAGETTRLELMVQRQVWLTEHMAGLTGEELWSLLAALPALERLSGYPSGV